MKAFARLFTASTCHWILAKILGMTVTYNRSWGWSSGVLQFLVN